MKILTICSPQRKFGKISNHIAKKINYGLIRLGHYVYEFDDREIARSQSLFHSRWGGSYLANKRFLEVCNNFQPETIILGHADIITSTAIKKCRKLLPNIKIAHWTVDAFEFKGKNDARFKKFSDLADAVFATTGRPFIDKYKTQSNRVAFIPNPVDRSIERFACDEEDTLSFDLLFCGSANKTGHRSVFIKKLAFEKRIADINFEVRGILEKPKVFGEEYDRLLQKARMGLNLSQLNHCPLYSSDRIAQLMGNGIMTFIPNSTGLKEIIHTGEAVFYSDYNDLVSKIIYYHQNDDQRKMIAKNGRLASHQRFSSERVAKFILEYTHNLPFSEQYEWLSHTLS